MSNIFPNGAVADHLAPRTAKKSDDYDVLVKSLQFDSKAKPQDKLKTEEELEKERVENLKQKEVFILIRI